MVNNNIVKIGVAIKWRGVFDINKKYYQDNVITLHGCVFRCKVLQTQGLSPAEFNEETGYLAFTNTDVWDVIVDMAYYYNYVVAQKNFNSWAEGRIGELQDEIDYLWEMNDEQWDAIFELENTDDSLKEEIEGLKEIDSQLNESDIQLQDQINQINETDDKLQKEIEALQEQCEVLQKKLDLIDYNMGSVTSDSVVSSGIWGNELYWINNDFWNNEKPAMGSICDCDKAVVQSLVTKFGDMTNEFQKQKNTILKLEEQISKIKYSSGLMIRLRGLQNWGENLEN